MIFLAFALERCNLYIMLVTARIVFNNLVKTLLPTLRVLKDRIITTHITYLRIKVTSRTMFIISLSYSIVGSNYPWRPCLYSVSTKIVEMPVKEIGAQNVDYFQKAFINAFILN